MTKDETGESRGFLSSAFLVAAVAIVLVLGMWLKTDLPRALSPAAGATFPAQDLPLGVTVTPEHLPATPLESPKPVATPRTVAADAVDPLIARLAARAAGDSGRLAKARGRWTAQLLVACKPETVDRVLARAAGASGLYVLPVQVNDDACFRVCFGTYATSKEASLAPDLPKALRGKEKPGAVEVAKVLP